jgi:hypothetical protein
VSLCEGLVGVGLGFGGCVDCLGIFHVIAISLSVITPIPRPLPIIIDYHIHTINSHTPRLHVLHPLIKLLITSLLPSTPINPLRPKNPSLDLSQPFPTISNTPCCLSAIVILLTKCSSILLRIPWVIYPHD